MTAEEGFRWHLRIPGHRRAPACSSFVRAPWLGGAVTGFQSCHTPFSGEGHAFAVAPPSPVRQ